MDTIIDEKLYRVVRKKNSHINTKLNRDGSKAAVQFTDDGNELNGPVNLIEVDEGELIRTEYVPIRDEPRTFKEIVLQDVVTPALQQFLYQALMEGYDSLCEQLKTRTFPILKEKSKGFVKNVGIVASGVKDGLAGKNPKALELLRKSEIVVQEKTNYSDSIADVEKKAVRTEEEVASIVNTMHISVAILAACIRVLNNTVMADDGDDPQLRIEIQKYIQTLSANDVMQQIELLLEDRNKALLDDDSLSLLSAFREGHFLVNDNKVPLVKYLDE